MKNDFLSFFFKMSQFLEKDAILQNHFYMLKVHKIRLVGIRNRI